MIVVNSNKMKTEFESKRENERMKSQESEKERKNGEPYTLCVQEDVEDEQAYNIEKENEIKGTT